MTATPLKPLTREEFDSLRQGFESLQKQQGEGGSSSVGSHLADPVPADSKSGRIPLNAAAGNLKYKAYVMYMAGLPWEQIVEEIGVSKKTIQSWLRKEECDRKEGGRLL